MTSTKWRVVALIIGLAYGLAGCSWFLPPEIEIQTIGFAPTEGAVHTTVTLVGQGFGETIDGGSIRFSGVSAEIQSWTDANIVVRIPVLATPTGRRTVPVEVRRAGELLGRGTFTVVRGILFQTDRDGRWEIYVMNPDGSQPTNLTDHAGHDTEGIWSPDGTKIAFVSTRDGDSEIYVMGADGSNATNLTNHPGSDTFPVWSPNGRKIAFMTDRESVALMGLGSDPKIFIPTNVEIFVMNADGTGQMNLTNHDSWDGFPSWSPDGRRIVFQTDRDRVGLIVVGIEPDGFGLEIYAMDADGANVSQLSSNPEDDVYPVWSPDGTKIAFQSYRDGNAEIYVMNPDGSGQMRLTSNPAVDVMPTWSPDGRWIAFQSHRDGNAEVYKVNASGGSVTRLTNASDADEGASWSPDGQQIVFQSQRDGNPEIYRMNADGSAVKQLTGNPAADVSPCWGTQGWPPMI